MLKWTTLALVAGLLGAGVAFAADAPPFDQVDTNRDGLISKTEAAAVPKLDFGKADRNGDGYLSQGEYAAAMK